MLALPSNSETSALPLSLVWKFLSQNEGCLEKYSAQINGALIALMLWNGSGANAIGKVIPMGFYGWIVAMLTGERLTYFWSCGMTGTLSQAIAHNISGELGTLDPRNLKLLKLGMSQTAYEFSHVVRRLVD